MPSTPVQPPAPLRAFVRSDAESRHSAAGSRGPIWMVPAAVATPSDEDDVRAVMSWCASEGLPVVPRGGATGMPGGNVGRGVVLDLSGLSRIDEPREGRIRAGAGSIAAAVDARARTAGQCVPALPSSAPWCTVGGMVATDAAGARSFGYGPVHAWTAALRVVTASGEARDVGCGPDESDGEPWGRLRSDLAALALPGTPQVAKNASGYAVDRFVSSGGPVDLLVGSEGTLAVVTEVTFETRPLPLSRGVALVGVPELDVLPSLVATARSLGASACEYFGRRLLDLGELRDDPRLAGLDVRDGVVLVEVEGEPDSVAGALDEIRRRWSESAGASVTTDPERVERLWALRHSASPSIARAAGARRSLQFIEDGVVPVAALPDYVRAVEAALARHGLDAVVFGHAGDGNLHVNPLIDLAEPTWRARVAAVLDDVTDRIVDLGGTPSGEHGDGRLRAPLLERVWGPARMHAFRMVKDRLDPEHLLNPGVVLPLPDQDPLDGLALGPDLQRLDLRPAGSAA